MMRQALLLMTNGSSSTTSDLAKALGVRPPVVKEVLAKLTALGYVQDTTCGARTEKSPKCVTCTFRNGCDFRSPQHVWVLTKKGRRAVSADH